MNRIRNAVMMALAVGVMGTPALAFAFGDGTPDCEPPAEEVVCDPVAGLRGAAYGLCVAYCEANDCDRVATVDPNCEILPPDKHACEVLSANFTRITGLGLIPCVVGGPH